MALSCQWRSRPQHQFQTQCCLAANDVEGHVWTAPADCSERSSSKIAISTAVRDPHATARACQEHEAVANLVGTNGYMGNVGAVEDCLDDRRPHYARGATFCSRGTQTAPRVLSCC